MRSKRKVAPPPTLEQAVREFLKRATQCSRDELGFVQFLPACYVEDLQEVYDQVRRRAVANPPSISNTPPNEAPHG